MRIKKRNSVSKRDGFRFGGPKRPYFELFLKSAKYISYSVISLCWLNKIFEILLFYNLIKKIC